MSSPLFIAALDQGTTSSRTLIYDHSGQVVAKAQREFTQHYPRSGWVEHDPMEIWEGQLATLREAMAQAKVAAADLAAIGITNQRETLVGWERATGRPVGPAIVWQDRRTAQDCTRLEFAGMGPLITAKTGLRLDPYFTGTKLAWLLGSQSGLRGRAEAGEVLAGTIDSWLLWNLTAGRVHATDASNASRTLLYNLDTGDWDDELLKIFGVPRAMLPEVRDSAGIFGRVATGQPAAGVPIAGIAGDQQAALFGQLFFYAGMAKNTWHRLPLLMQTEGHRVALSHHDLLTTVVWQIDGVRSYVGGGGVCRWCGGAVGALG